MDTISLILSCFVMSLAAVSCQNPLLNETCQTMYKSNGTCITVFSCPLALELIKKKDIKLVRSMLCGFEGNTPLVCCPLKENNDTIVFNNNQSETATSRPNRRPTTVKEMIMRTSTAKPKVQPDLFPDRKICGQIRNLDKIIGGTNTEIDEFPWLARIKYRNEKTSTEHFACGGSLITNQYVLTAAHCLMNISGQIPIHVRLGEWDEETEQDCFEGFCNDKPLDVKIRKIIPYPEFRRNNPSWGDIALLQLEEPVNFTDFIQPICLPTTEYIAAQDYVQGSAYTTAGWGVTEYGRTSPIKRKVALEALSTNFCKQAYPIIPDSSLSRLLCAGGTSGKDSCKGDSGGPLAREVSENYQLNWFLFGVTSFGSSACGTEGVPGLYTRVTKYMDWIRDTIISNRSD